MDKKHPLGKCRHTDGTITVVVLFSSYHFLQDCNNLIILILLF